MLNSKCAAEIEWHCKHYASRGLMKKCLSGAELAKFIDVSPATLEKTFKQYNEAARNPCTDLAAHNHSCDFLIDPGVTALVINAVCCVVVSVALRHRPQRPAAPWDAPPSAPYGTAPLTARLTALPSPRLCAVASSPAPARPSAHTKHAVATNGSTHRRPPPPIVRG